MRGANEKALEELAAMTGMAGTTFVAGETHQSAYNEGIRSIGLRLIALSQKEVLKVTKQTFKSKYTRRT